MYIYALSCFGAVYGLPLCVQHAASAQTVSRTLTDQAAL